jgi:hypothetical protein
MYSYTTILLLVVYMHVPPWTAINDAMLNLVTLSFSNSFSFFSFIIVLGEGTLWKLQRFLQCIKNTILEFIPSTDLLYPPPPIPRIVSTGIVFTFTYIYIHFLYYILPFTPFTHHMPALTGMNHLTYPLLRSPR